MRIYCRNIIQYVLKFFNCSPFQNCPSAYYLKIFYIIVKWSSQYISQWNTYV